MTPRSPSGGPCCTFSASILYMLRPTSTRPVDGEHTQLGLRLHDFAVIFLVPAASSFPAPSAFPVHSRPHVLDPGASIAIAAVFKTPPCTYSAHGLQSRSSTSPRSVGGPKAAAILVSDLPVHMLGSSTVSLALRPRRRRLVWFWTLLDLGRVSCTTQTPAPGSRSRDSESEACLCLFESSRHSAKSRGLARGLSARQETSPSAV
mmetsp:Transcript_46181/g.108368  ORF Transcript_46181/g.108368 Transcript_46181/m.108368 type:complete len:205 (+) Transcript_46181:2137-2751(+)